MEGIMPFVFFVVLGAYLFFKSKTHPKMFVVSVLSFSLGMYTYFPSRLFIPLFFLLLLSLFPKSVPFKRLSLMILAISIMVIFSLPFIASIADGTFSARINQVSIFSDPPKNETVLSHITTNYFRHFSMDFLFTKGDIDMPGQFITRQSIRGMGELYLFELPLILLGFVYLFYKQKKIGLFLLFWLLLYPTGSMFTTNESPYATRSIIGVIPLTLLSGVGLRYLFALIKRMGKFVYYPAVAVVCAVIVVSFFWFAHLYFQEYPLYSSDFWGWQYGAGPVVKYFVTHQKEYDDLALAGDFNAPEIFLKFYAPNGECSKCKISSPADIYDPTRKQLFAMTDDDINRARQFSYTTKDIIYYPDGKEAFRLVEVEKR